MPLTRHGAKVRKAMRARYGPRKGERIFRATANSARHGGRGRIGGRRVERRRRGRGS